MSDPNRPRPKVGDKDPDFEANQKRKAEKAARVKAQREADAKERGAMLSEHSKSSPKPKSKGVLATMGELLNKPDGQGGPGGKDRRRAIDKVVDEAVGAAKAETYY